MPLDCPCLNCPCLNCQRYPRHRNSPYLRPGLEAWTLYGGLISDCHSRRWPPEDDWRWPQATYSCGYFLRNTLGSNTHIPNSPINAAPAAMISINLRSSPLVDVAESDGAMLRTIYQLVNFVLHPGKAAFWKSPESLAFRYDSLWAGRLARVADCPKCRLPEIPGRCLLFQQHLGDDYPETEQTDKGGAGDNSFHGFLTPSKYCMPVNYCMRVFCRQRVSRKYQGSKLFVN